MSNGRLTFSGRRNITATRALTAMTLCGMLVAGMSSASPSAQTPQSDRVVAVMTDYEVPPATLDLAWNKAPVIVLARVQSSTPREIAGAKQMRAPITEHRVTVLEVFKGAEQLGQVKTLSVTQDSVEEGRLPGGVRHSSGGRVFRAAEEYLLFLEFKPGQSSFGVAWGAAGAYKVEEVSVEIPGASRRMWFERDSVPRWEFIATLRAKRDARHGK